MIRIGEIPMKLRQSVHQEAISAARQYDLFASATEGSAQAVLPEWASLSEETRRTLTGLLARLILDHATADHSQSSEEAQP